MSYVVDLHQMLVDLHQREYITLLPLRYLPRDKGIFAQSKWYTQELYLAERLLGEVTIDALDKEPHCIRANVNGGEVELSDIFVSVSISGCR